MNEGKRLKNLQRAAAATASASSASADANLGGHLIDPKTKKDMERAAKKSQLEGDILRSKRSTASMGRFDKTLPQEGKAFKTKGIKRKFDPTERDVSDERSQQLGVLDRMDRHGMKAGRSSMRGQGDAALVNERKAVKFASGGRGGIALARDGARGGRGGGRGGRGGKRGGR